VVFQVLGGFRFQTAFLIFVGFIGAEKERAVAFFEGFYCRKVESVGSAIISSYIGTLSCVSFFKVVRKRFAIHLADGATQYNIIYSYSDMKVIMLIC